MAKRSNQTNYILVAIFAAIVLFGGYYYYKKDKKSSPDLDFHPRIGTVKEGYNREFSGAYVSAQPRYHKLG